MFRDLVQFQFSSVLEQSVGTCVCLYPGDKS